MAQLSFSSPHSSAVISHLSTGDHAVDEETFQSTLKYIFKFIEKVRIVVTVTDVTNADGTLYRRNKLKQSSKSFANVSG